MKTLSINPFNLRPQIKNMLRRPKHVVIPAEFPKEFGNKLLAMQHSLDYMATNYGINFDFISIPFHLHAINSVKEKDLSIDKVTCSKNDNHSDSELIHTERDDDIDVARNIYMAASNVLKSEEKKTEDKLYGVNVQDIPDILKPTFKIYSGILEYYAKKYDGMTFTVNGVNVENSLVDKNPPKIIIACEYGSKKAEMTLYKVDHAAHASDENAFYTAWGYNLNDFHEDKVYEKIHQMVKNVLKGENE